MARIGRPPRTDWPACKVDGCTKTTKGGAKGFCRTHYVAARRGQLDWSTGEELRPKKRVASYGPGARCLVAGCQSRPAARGLCNRHNLQHRKGADLGVELASAGHERAARAYGAAECRVDGCSKRPVNRWMCSMHAQQREAGILDEEGNQLRALLPSGRRPLDCRKESAGYVLVRAPEDHPGARHDGSICEHRLVMEQHVGRYLMPGEVVHHLNGVKDDNRIENLQLRRSRREHGPGHERLDDMEAALVLLEQPVNKGMSNGSDVKRRLRRLARRL